MHICVYKKPIATYLPKQWLLLSTIPKYTGTAKNHTPTQLSSTRSQKGGHALLRQRPKPKGFQEENTIMHLLQIGKLPRCTELHISNLEGGMYARLTTSTKPHGSGLHLHKECDTTQGPTSEEPCKQILLSRHLHLVHVSITGHGIRPHYMPQGCDKQY